MFILSYGFTWIGFLFFLSIPFYLVKTLLQAIKNAKKNADIRNSKKVREASMDMPHDKIYTTADIYALPNGQRAELIDGQLYMMSPPSTTHQRILYSLARKISEHIDGKNGNCEVFLSPFAVFLSKDDKNYVEPDISVICDSDKLDDRGCHGAPDWIIEIVSPSTERVDYGIKLFKYRSAGVLEYWIINPKTRTVNVFDFERDQASKQYSFHEEIPVCIYEDLSICIDSLLS